MSHNTAMEQPAIKGWFEKSGRLYEQRIRDLSLLRRLSDSISLELDVEQATDYILDIVIDELNITNGSIMLYDEVTGELNLQCARGELDPVQGRHALVHPLRIKKGEGIAGSVLQSGVPVLITDAEADPRFVSFEKQAVSVGSLLCLPLIVRGKSIGVLNLSHAEKSAFTEGDLHGLIVVANQIAMLLDNAANYKQVCRANAELEDKVKERTEHLEVANRELQQTRSSLVQSERLKALGQMASGVAHDFNNTLAGIIGNTQLMLEEVADPKLEERLRAVELAARDGAATIKRIQEFSRVNRNTEFEPLDLNQLVRDTVKILSPLWKDQAQKRGQNIDLVTRLGKVPTVEGNAPELREVLTNILMNALDAMPTGGQIVLSSWSDDASACLAIADTGTGMSQEIRERLFDPFFTSKGPGNSGLGLSVAYGIVRRHGGNIEVETIEGKGTTFIVSLPASKAEIAPPIEREPIRTVPRAKILLIDDDPFVRNALKAMLEYVGHEVVTVDGGQEGIDRFDAEPFALVVTDLGMPGLSGWEVAAAVKQKRPVVPVMLITGWGREIDLDDAKARGVDFVLAKPFELSQVTNAIAEALETLKHS